MEYCHIQCEGDCDNIRIRIAISPDILGKTVVVQCPICKTKSRVTIPERIIQGSTGTRDSLGGFSDKDIFSGFTGFEDIFGRK